MAPVTSCEPTYFVGHHGKPPARFPRPCRFDGGIESEKVGLFCNVPNDIQHDTDGFAFRSLFSGPVAPKPVPELDRRLMRVIGKIEEEARWDFNLAELAVY